MRQKIETRNSGSVISVFSTPLNWMGLLGVGDELVSVFVGHASAKTILAAARRSADHLIERDWNPELRTQLEAYADGQAIDFSTCPIQLPTMTPFRRKVIEAVRKLAYGQTTTYGELARQAGHPRAARAVGTVMSTNRFPILVPCHRVLAAGNQLGGYSSPLGTDFKRRLLDLEERVVSDSGFLKR